MPTFENMNMYLVVATLLVGYYTYKWIIYPLYLSPLCKIPGPPPDYFLIGSFLEFLKPGGGLDWAKKYGSVYKCYGLFNEPRIYILDGKILQKIFVSESYTKYGKKKGFLGIFKDIIGEGISAVEGDVHKRQRKLMNPSFGHNSVKNMLPAFTKVSNTLKDLWKYEIKNNQNVNNNGKKSAMIDVGFYMGKISLDIIGIVGFNYELKSLTTTSTLADSLGDFLNKKNVLTFNLLTFSFPILKSMPLKINKTIKATSTEIKIFTKKLVQDKFDEMQKGKLDSNDLVSVLLKANYEEGIDKNEQMSLEEIRNQVMTFLIAGHETTSVSLAWTLYHLSRDQEIQDKLREEIVKTFPDKDFVPEFDQINSMEYLNAVCKETLRFNTPVQMLNRTTKEDTIINGYVVPKGSEIYIPIYQIHRLPSIWGDDVEEYKPSRWFTEKVKTLSNYNYLPFSTGTRSCIGSKLALNEMKVILCVLLRNFQFHEIEGWKVTSKLSITLKPDPTVKLWVSEIDY